MKKQNFIVLHRVTEAGSWYVASYCDADQAETEVARLSEEFPRTEVKMMTLVGNKFEDVTDEGDNYADIELPGCNSKQLFDDISKITEDYIALKKLTGELK